MIPVVYLFLWATFSASGTFAAASCKNVVHLAKLDEIIRNQTQMIRDLSQVVENQKKVNENQTQVNEQLKKTIEYLTTG